MTDPLSFREYQTLASATDKTDNADLLSNPVPLLGLAGEVGSLLTEYKKFLRDGTKYRPFQDQVAEEIGDVLWYLATIARKAGLDLEDIANENLAKLHERWPASSQPELLGPRFYDEGFDASEQLPRDLRVEFRQVVDQGATKLEMSIDGERQGNLLTDNAHYDDGYRFHDVFHLTNAIMLGWSPVSRKLLGCKRKSIPQLDEVEDGARAAITEEAISAVVFGVAKDYSFFDDLHAVDFDLLRTVKTMTRPFEVRDRTYREWEETILAGYEVWREMARAGGGVLVGDANKRSVHFEPLTA
mgnify:CR=1 FL=1